MTKKKILIIGRIFSSERGVSGPSSIIMSLVKEFQDQNVNFELLGYDSDKMSKLQYFLQLFKSVLFSKKLIVNVHTEGFLIPFIVYLISMLNHKNEYYLTVHGIYVIQTKFTSLPIKASTKFQEKILIKSFPNIICVSEMLKNDIKRLFNRGSKVFVGNNGIYIQNAEFKNISLHEENIRLITTGGVKKIKGIFESLELVQYINSKSENLKVYLDVYGGFDDEKTLADFGVAVKHKGLNHFVSYKGIIKDKKELYEKYAESHFNIALSHYDTFNAAVLESMACGTPTIASSKCGASFLINQGVDGFVVEMEHSYKENIYQIIQHFAQESDSFDLVRKNAYNTSRKHDWHKAAKAYVDILYKTKNND
jgi:glycosyltransferase involved in cell wall biosynthesis